MHSIAHLSIVLLTLGLVGCGDVPRYVCADQSQPCYGSDASDAGAVLDAGTDGPLCAGACLPTLPDGWRGPTLLWTGASDAVPTCPPEAPHVDYDGHADLVEQPATCPACSCSAPSGTCAPPEALIANAATCPPGLGVSQIPFAHPVDSSCIPVSSLPAGAVCGTGPCLQSVTIPPLTLVETGCTPSMEAPPAPAPPSWGTAARACSQDRLGWCTDIATVCAPAPVAEFSMCLDTAGDQECPSDWPVKHIFYQGADDARSCAPCTCDAPAGGSCSTYVSIYEDAACSMLLENKKVGSASSTCSDVSLTNVALGSAQVDKLTYAPGACTAGGGEPVGAVAPTAPTTFCCQP